MTEKALVSTASWESLRRFTDARIALGRAGNSLPTRAHLAFQLAHAQARDAVHLPLDALGLAAELRAQGHEPLLLHSAASDRARYLQRPDEGRRLDDASRQRLLDWKTAALRDAAFDVAFVIADGLSALAVHANALALLQLLLARLRADASQTWSVAPMALVEQGRVAVGDEVAEGLNANCVVLFIGERPGLSSPDSLGVYITWAPRVGRTDAQRNCISNVRQGGLAPGAAADKAFQILCQSRSRGLTGVDLKDEVDENPVIAGADKSDFEGRRLTFSS
jgi:ethanolamine ammonia-lyase small subunit